MQIVIDIPEEVYRAYKMDTSLGSLNEDQRGYAKWYLIHGLVNGTPLPKGHGRLIDADDLIQEFSVVSSRPIKSQLYILREAPTIIEADKAEKE